MKQVIIQVTNELTIVMTIQSDFCQIFRCGIPIWAGNHQELINLLEKVYVEKAA